MDNVILLKINATMDIRKPSILLVDDESDILEFLSYNFYRHGFDLRTAADGREGIEKASMFHPDVIISDIRMPQMDGIEMCNILKNDDGLKSIPIIFLTADSDEYLALSANNAGGEEYVNKPISVNILLMIIKNTMERSNNYITHS
jgi:two-component system alkaline phosphatase synthesis response regulator PhoP